MQEREKNESGELYSDGLRRDVAQSASRERTSLQSDRLLLVATQGASRCRPLAQRLTNFQKGPKLPNCQRLFITLYE